MSIDQSHGGKGWEAIPGCCPVLILVSAILKMYHNMKTYGYLTLLCINQLHPCISTPASSTYMYMRFRLSILHYHIAGIFHQEKIFANFHHLLPLAKILSANFFSCINDYTVDVVTFTALAKIIPGEIFMQYMSASFGEVFLS